MHILLYEPEIPQNTGNIVRTCANTGSSLLLFNPKFSTSDRRLKRAGLDYWEGVQVDMVACFFTFLSETVSPVYFLSSRASKPYTEIPFTQDAVLVFGSEGSGLPETVRTQWGERVYTIPKKQGVRCLNLATAVGIVLYEGLRQTNFCSLT